MDISKVPYANCQEIVQLVGYLQSVGELNSGLVKTKTNPACGKEEDLNSWPGQLNYKASALTTWPHPDGGVGGGGAQGVTTWPCLGQTVFIDNLVTLPCLGQTQTPFRIDSPKIIIIIYPAYGREAKKPTLSSHLSLYRQHKEVSTPLRRHTCLHKLNASQIEGTLYKCTLSVLLAPQ